MGALGLVSLHEVPRNRRACGPASLTRISGAWRPGAAQHRTDASQHAVPRPRRRILRCAAALMCHDSVMLPGARCAAQRDDATHQCCSSAYACSQHRTRACDWTGTRTPRRTYDTHRACACACAIWCATCACCARAAKRKTAREECARWNCSISASKHASRGCCCAAYRGNADTHAQSSHGRCSVVLLSMSSLLPRTKAGPRSTKCSHVSPRAHRGARPRVCAAIGDSCRLLLRFAAA